VSIIFREAKKRFLLLFLEKEEYNQLLWSVSFKRNSSIWGVDHSFSRKLSGNSSSIIYPSGFQFGGTALFIEKPLFNDQVVLVKVLDQLALSRRPGKSKVVFVLLFR
jgi:hypothetical protein